MRTVTGALLWLCLTASPAWSQDSPVLAIPALADSPVTLTYQNRSIAVLRARVLNRTPAERAAAAGHVLDLLAGQRITGPVTTSRAGEVITLFVAEHPVITLSPVDADALIGETVEAKADIAAASLRRALLEADELRQPRHMAVAAVLALGATVAFGFLLVLLVRLRRRMTERALARMNRELGRLPTADAGVLPLEGLRHGLSGVLTTMFVALVALSAYVWLTFVLRRFPYTRPWGESLREFLISRVSMIAMAIVHAAPGVFTAVLIILIGRFLVRFSNNLFDAIAAGRIPAAPIYVETAKPTRRLVAAALWALTVVQAYPFLPGSGTEAFAGVSLFLGLMVSLGASGVANQAISSFVLTYTRAVRIGEYVRIGETEGTVTELGLLSAKVRTPLREEVTIPNAVILSETTTNYSRYHDEGVYVSTALTIGYDVPWRQVHALLQLAAERTGGIRGQPQPLVHQSALEDSYVRYTLMVSLEREDQRVPVLNVLHANIQDLFNEHDVQIMSPNYEGDPIAPKVVPKDRWHAAPAATNEWPRPRKDEQMAGTTRGSSG